MDVFELSSAVELVTGCVLGLEVIRLRTRKPPAPTVNECECDHASAFHDEQGCHAGASVKRRHVSQLGQVYEVGGGNCGCRRFTRKGTFYDPNTENDLERLDRLAKLDEVQRVKRILPAGWPNNRTDKRKGL